MDSSQEITQLKTLSQCKNDKLHCKKSLLANLLLDSLRNSTLKSFSVVTSSMATQLNCNNFCILNFSNFMHIFFYWNLILSLCYSNILMAKKKKKLKNSHSVELVRVFGPRVLTALTHPRNVYAPSKNSQSCPP